VHYVPEIVSARARSILALARILRITACMIVVLLPFGADIDSTAAGGRRLSINPAAPPTSPIKVQVRSPVLGRAVSVDRRIAERVKEGASIASILTGNADSLGQRQGFQRAYTPAQNHAGRKNSVAIGDQEMYNPQQTFNTSTKVQYEQLERAAFDPIQKPLVKTSPRKTAQDGGAQAVLDYQFAQSVRSPSPRLLRKPASASSAYLSQSQVFQDSRSPSPERSNYAGGVRRGQMGIRTAIKKESGGAAGIERVRFTSAAQALSHDPVKDQEARDAEARQVVRSPSTQKYASRAIGSGFGSVSDLVSGGGNSDSRKMSLGPRPVDGGAGRATTKNASDSMSSVLGFGPRTNDHLFV
jgi:hypothetical protein